jgi:hypothetical protein
MAAVDRFALSGVQSLLSPPEHAYAITPSDSADLDYVTTHLSAAVAGVAVVVTKGGETVAIPLAAGVQTRIRAVRVKATNTTATGIVGFD